MEENKWILGYGFGVMLSIALFKTMGVTITKNASAAQRATIDTSRTVLVWIFFLGWPYKGRENFHWL